MTAVPVVEMRGITTRYPGVVANDAVDLDLREGEIHALVGENGAGKTTLVRALAGLVRPDEGEILLRGCPVTVRGAGRAAALGIGMVHQHFMLVPRLTVAENVYLGRERWVTASSRRRVREEVAEQAREAGFDLDPDRRVEDLTVAEEQRVEILRVLSRGARILILDEPTALLTPRERDALLDMVRRLVRHGRSVIFVTHRLGEVTALADRVTVLRRGRSEGTFPVASTDEAGLARRMLGHDLAAESDERRGTPGDPVLSIRGLHVRGDRDEEAVRGVDLTVRAGEIVGLAAIEGNGQRELLDAVVGLRSARAEVFEVAGTDARRAFSPRRAAAAGVGHVPGDRLGVGLVADLTVEENLLLGRQREAGLGGAVLSRASLRRRATRLLEEHDIRPADPTLPAGALSGGNQQKLVVAREIDRPGLRLLVAHHPTRGVDVGAVAAIHARLRAARDAGVGILLHAHDLGELIRLSDRIVVLYRGRVAAETRPEDADEDALGARMTGAAS